MSLNLRNEKMVTSAKFTATSHFGAAFPRKRRMKVAREWNVGMHPRHTGGSVTESQTRRPPIIIHYYRQLGNDIVYSAKESSLYLASVLWAVQWYSRPRLNVRPPEQEFFNIHGVLSPSQRDREIFMMFKFTKC